VHDIIIRSHINEQFLMNVWPNQTSHEIKQEVLDKWNIPFNRQRLGFAEVAGMLAIDKMEEIVKKIHVYMCQKLSRPK
jgi:hypothetical protein